MNKKVLKKFRVIVKDERQRINGMQTGEEFEAQWPDPWLERRIAAHQIEMIADPKPKRTKVEKPKNEEKEEA